VEKRLPLALLLSFLVLIAWTKLVPKPPPPLEPPARTGEPAAAPGGARAPAQAPPGTSSEPGVQTPAPPALGQVIGEGEERTLELRVGQPGRPGSYLARFSNRGGSLTELYIGDSWDAPGLSAGERADESHWVHLVDSVPLGGDASRSLVLRPSDKQLERQPLDQALWSMRTLGPAGAPDGVEFRIATGNGLVYTKRLLFQPESYDLALELEIENEARVETGPLQFQFTPAAVVPMVSGDNFYKEPQAVALARDSKKLKAETQKLDGNPPTGAFNLPAEVSFAGVQNKYFAVLMRGATELDAASMTGATWRSVPDERYAAENPTKAAKAFRYMVTEVLLSLRAPALGEKAAWSYRIYAGPKSVTTLEAAYPEHETLVARDLGFFDGIAHVLVGVLNFFQRVTGNWGVAIIFLTVTVRLVLFPINRRSQTSMARYQKKMKRIQPMIEELKKKHAKNPDKLRQEQAALMQRERAFPPLGGCLPIFLQLPVFFGLFSALRASYPLRQAPFFLWIQDLSMPDRLMRIDFNTHLPVIGTIEYLNILPPMMVVLWILQQKTMPKPADEQAARMQKMMMWMPIVMGFFLYNYAAGLSLYMITQSSLGILEMSVIKKVWPIDDTELPPKQGGFFQKLAEKQKELERMHKQKGSRGGGGGLRRKPKRG
jgi:YidC/Oxa1 family membrane protein insertase